MPGFTPINRRATAPHLEEGVKLGNVLNSASDVASQSSSPRVHGKKRVASQPQTLLPAIKKPRRPYHKKSEKPTLHAKLGGPEITSKFSQKKHSTSRSSVDCEDAKSKTRQDDKIASLREQSLNAGLKISANTLGKLAAFRYQADPQESTGKAKAAKRIDQANLPRRLEKPDFKATKPENADSYLYTEDRRYSPGKESKYSRETMTLSNEPARRHEISYNPIHITPSSLAKDVLNPFNSHIPSCGNDMLENSWEHGRGTERGIEDSLATPKLSVPHEFSSSIGSVNQATIGLTNLADRDLFSLYTYEDAGASENEGSHGDHTSQLGHSYHTQLCVSPETKSILGTAACLEDPELFEDEFPMDENHLGNDRFERSVLESFEPPLSLQFPFDDNSQTNEVYDPGLQFSEPSSRRSIHTAYRDGGTISIEGQTTFDVMSSPFFRSSSSYSLASISQAKGDANTLYLQASDVEDENFLSDDDEQDLIKLSVQDCQAQSPISSASDPRQPLSPKLQWNVPTLYEPRRPTAQLPADSPHKQSPIPLNQAITKSRHPQPIATSSKNVPIPFARPAFPTAVRDRSSIVGLSRSTSLRSCFRIGEALNAGCSGARHNIDIVIELYARVTYSERDSDGIKQHFQFADLFTSERPPFLNGLYTVWKGIELWDYDSKAFLGEKGIGKIARTIGRIKRDEKSKSWKLMILSIWKATWDDVEYAKGIVCS